MSDEQMGFGWDQTTAGGDAARTPPRAADMVGRLRKLADRGVFLGTSSWKYPGWISQVYDETRYHTRGKLSKKKFDRECLAEYSGLFPTVCGDFAFYQFPSEATWHRTFAQLPPGYHFSLKVPEEVTIERYPKLPRYGARAGKSNGHFMDAGLVRDQLLGPLEPHLDKLGVLMFQFGTIHDAGMSQPEIFADSLDGMLSDLPTERFKFAVEVRNPKFLEPPSAYLSCLETHGVAHCLNSWSRMPSISEQMQQLGIFTAGHVAARFLLKPGRTYEQAVKKFAPYEKVQEEYPEGRSALRDLIDNCLQSGQQLFAFVNNRFEGNAIDTIRSAIE